MATVIWGSVHAVIEERQKTIEGEGLRAEG
jgi:hypothetical protein